MLSKRPRFLPDAIKFSIKISPVSTFSRFSRSVSRPPLTQKTEFESSPVNHYFHIVNINLLSHVNVLCSFPITDHHSDPCENMADSLAACFTLPWQLLKEF